MALPCDAGALTHVLAIVARSRFAAWLRREGDGDARRSKAGSP